MKQRYRYRLYPTSAQEQSLARLFGCVRVVWNDALSLSNKHYHENGAGLKNSELQKLLITQAKRTPARSWLGEVATVPLQQSIADLGVAFKNFFASASGKRKGPKVRMPRFKKRRNAQSARFTRPSIKWDGDKLRLPSVGTLKVKWSRKLPSDASSVTVIKDASDRYFVSFVVDVEPDLLPWNDKAVGVDLGITTFAALDDGTKIDAPKPLKRYQRKLSRLQRRLSRCEKGSNRRKRAVLAVAKVHARIKDIRTDFLHQLSTKLIRENQSISLEDLNVSGMMRNHCLAKAISDLGWQQFRTMLEAKAEMYGRDVSVISRWEPTSQTCSSCGHREGRKKLSVREWQCLSCGALHDRDTNAAKNIKAAGGHSEAINGRLRARKTSSLAMPVEASNQPYEVTQLSLCF